MSWRTRVRWMSLFAYLITVAFATLGFFMSDWFYLVMIYIIIHVLFGPLDWYLVYKAYRWLRRGR